MGTSDDDSRGRSRWSGPLLVFAALNLVLQLALPALGVPRAIATLVALLASATVVVVGVLLMARRGPDRSPLD
ncbi:hypothetical protein [Microlunatus sagamiharensis]|uniref:hypothetical protein n=1 Tax=Microlunatus sagamiharensis TaxID=546874 RepID=UPI000B80395D|nr:hypothetical protein [Microlunatus sagamiharensis]